MKWQWITPSQNSGNPVQVLYEINEDGYSVMRKPYIDMACKQCGKLDEYAALKHYVPELEINARKRHFGNTDDDYYWCNEEFREAVSEYGITGLSFYMVNSVHSIMIPENILKLDPDRSGLDFRGNSCELCGRHREVLFTPFIFIDEFDLEPKSAYSTNLRPENSQNRYAEIFFPSDFMDFLKDRKIKGIDWLWCKNNEFG